MTSEFYSDWTVTRPHWSNCNIRPMKLGKYLDGKMLVSYKIDWSDLAFFSSDIMVVSDNM